MVGAGYLVFEMYPDRKDYCGQWRSGGTTQADGWMAAYFQNNPRGDGTKNGFIWVWSQYPAYQPQMRVMFGVHDAMVCNGACDNPAGPIQYMDRMFYVWKLFMGSQAISQANGGPGSYEWDELVDYATRDDNWATLWTEYIVNGDSGPHYGMTTCS